MKPLRIFLMAALFLVVFSTGEVEAERGVELSVDVIEVNSLPGENATFSAIVKNTGNESDTILLSILDDNLDWATVDPESVDLDVNETASITVTVALPEYENSTGQARSALEGNSYEIRIKAKCESDLSISETEDLTTEIGDVYGASLTVIGSNVRATYASAEVNEEDRRVKFTLRLMNLGNRQDSILLETIETTYPDEWEVYISGPSDCSSNFSGSIGAGAYKTLYLCVTPDADSDKGNYTLITEASANGGTETAVSITTTVEVYHPIRDLAVTAIDVFQEIYPEYGGSSSQNSVKFKVTLENTGSHKDTYIPEVESTLENGWSVSFWQDSGKTQSWPASGVDIEAGELDDLWIFVEVDDEADEGNVTIQIAIRDEEEDPDAREEISLTVIVQRPELTISPDNIRLEIEGAIGNASMVEEGDTVVVLVDVENTGTADADGVRVEVFYYPKKSPTTQQEIDNLLIAGFEFDDAKNTYIYTLYDKEANIKSGNSKTIASDDWFIQSGEWYVEARVDYDEDDSNGKILEPNENNNDARYSDLLRVKPDLSIDSMRIDSKYAGAPPAQVPNIDDTVTFTVTISNRGSADVSDARLYITADSSSDNEILIERSNKEYVQFDVDAGETTDVRFRWKATEDEWSSFRAEINPVCDDYDIQSFECESEGDGFSSETDRMFDELNRYTNNEYPTTGVFEQDGGEVRFEILPDFKIKKVSMDPSDPRVGDDVEVTVTIENIGNSDWQVGSKHLSVVFEDGAGTEITTTVGESINKDDSAEVKFTWTVPDEDRDTLFLTFTIDPGSGSFEISQCNSCDDTNSGDGKDNDEFEYTVAIRPPDGGCVHGDNKIADDNYNQCVCDDGEWVCTEVDNDDRGGDFRTPTVSLVSSIVAVAVIALRRRY